MSFSRALVIVVLFAVAPVFAQVAPRELFGTIWRFDDSDGEVNYSEFKPDGAVYYHTPNGFFRNGAWKQQGNTLLLDTNKKYAERKGELTAEGMAGTGTNRVGGSWKWTAKMVGRSTYKPAENVSGTIWRVAESDGSKYLYLFQPNGELHYLGKSGFFTNGTWTQTGAKVYTETNRKYSERTGELTQDGMSGVGKNTAGAEWKWSAEQIGELAR